MRTTSHLLRANLRAHSRRYIATGIAIAISLIFVTLALNFASGLKSTINSQLISRVQGAAVVVSGGESHPDLTGAAERIRSVDGVKQAEPSVQAFVQLVKGDARFTQPLANIMPEPFEQIVIKEGQRPTMADEILLAESAAQALDAKVGDTITIKPTGDSVESAELRVVGITPSGFVGRVESFVTLETLEKNHLPYDISLVVVQADDSFGGDNATPEQQEQLAGKVKDAISGMPEANKIQADAYQRSISSLQDEANKIFGSVFLGMLVFPAISGVVALIVVNSTFQVILHQRKRDMALLRAVGARGGQLRRLLLAETLTVGAIASAIAVGIGTILSALALWGVDFASSFLGAFRLISPLSALAVFAVGTLLTVVVGIRPALGAARISPMAALSPVEDSPAAYAPSTSRPSGPVFRCAGGQPGGDVLRRWSQ